MDAYSSTPPTSAIVSASTLPADAPANPTSENEHYYDEMIGKAIAALDRGKGSTKKAIVNFLEKTYKGLPLNLKDLLTERLKAMTSTDRLVMVKRSYHLSHSPSPSPRKRGRPCKSKLDELPPHVPLVYKATETRVRPLNIQNAITAVPVSWAPSPDSAVHAYALPPSRALPQAVGAGTSGGVRTPEDSPGSAAAWAKKVTPVEEELRRKLEHFQSKVNQYICKIKPHFSIDSEMEVIEAIKGLEALARMDLDGPLHTSK